MIKQLLSILFLFIVIFSFGQNIKYKLGMNQPQNHYYQVEIELSDLKKSEFNLKMPIWAPGSYLAREFAKNVNLVKAFDFEGNNVSVKKIDKNTWKINGFKGDRVVIKYEVYAFELSVRTSFLDLTHGFVSGSGVFMYVEGLKNKSGLLEIIPHKSFKEITTALNEETLWKAIDGSRCYKFNNYVFTKIFY